MEQNFLIDGPERAKHSILLAHGAGAPMDSPAMTAIAKSLTEVGFRIVRFEFDYMASRRTSSGRKPPPRAEMVKSEYVAAIAALKARGPLIIGGKSMGGRVASMIADECRAAGLLCLGYPFHPVGKPTQLRTAHLAGLKTPALIIQGTRDPFGTRDEVATYKLSTAIEVLWLEDGDHDLRPRKAVSGFSMADHLKTMAVATAAWAAKIS
jgi:predicted alpha/beta-hydrolase family hydrolase